MAPDAFRENVARGEAEQHPTAVPARIRIPVTRHPGADRIRPTEINVADTRFMQRDQHSGHALHSIDISGRDHAN